MFAESLKHDTDSSCEPMYDPLCIDIEPNQTAGKKSKTRDEVASPDRVGDRDPIVGCQPPRTDTKVSVPSFFYLFSPVIGRQSSYIATYL